MDENRDYGRKREECHKNSDDIIDAYRRETNSCIMENQKAQDQMIFTVSAAFFGLMPFLLDKFQNIPCSDYLLFPLLLSNAAALIFTLLSFWFCKKGAEEDFEPFEQYSSIEAFENHCNNKPERSCNTSRGEVCNTVSLVSMMATIILVLLLLLLYLSNKETNMASQNNNGSQQSSSVEVIGEGCTIKFKPDMRQTSQPQSQTKNDNESSKTSKEDKNDKKQ